MVLRRRALLVLAAVGLTAGLLVGALAAALHCRRQGDSSCHRAGHGASMWGWVRSGWAAGGDRNIISGADGIAHGTQRTEGTVVVEPAGGRRGRGRCGTQPTLREERGTGREWAWQWREQLRTWRRRALLQYEFFPAGFPVLLNPALDVIDGVGRPGLVQPPSADRDAAAATASLCLQVGPAAAGTLAQCANLPGGPRPTGGRRLRSLG